MADPAGPRDGSTLGDYLPYDERETLRFLCRLLLDCAAAVKGAQGSLDDSAELSAGQRNRRQRQQRQCSGRQSYCSGWWR